MTTFAAGSGQRIVAYDLGACYPAGTVVWFATDGYWSASWPGHTKRWDMYIVAGATMAALAAAEAAVDAGGSGYIFTFARDATTDSTAGGETFIHATNQNTSPLVSTARYISLYAKPQFNSGIPWYTNGASTLGLGPTALGGASTTTCPAVTPAADFSGMPLAGRPPLTVAFTDLSTNTPTSWAWDFGDGGTSAAQNPSHVYPSAGTYTVSLTAANTGGSDSESKVAYVHVLPPISDDVHEIVPPGDSINFVGTLDDAFNKSIRPVRNEPGSGQLTINRNSPNATAAILKPGNLVKVTIPQIDPDPIFAWFMEPETSTLISLNEEGGEDITIGGRGALSYWDRVIWQAMKYTIPWWPATMATPPGGTRGAVIVAAGTYRHYTIAGDVITGYANFTTAGFSAYFDSRQTYQWPSAGSKRFLSHLTTTEDPSSPDYTGYYFHPHQDGVTEYLPSYATGTTSTVLLSDISADKPGAILYRMYQEGTDASRPDQPIPLMTIDFTATTDSNGDPWATTDALAGVTAELGETFLDTIVKLLATGVIDVEMGPDLDMHAYNAQGRDLTGTSFGAGVVRFAKGVNIADELRRERSNVPVATHIEVIGTDGAVGTAVLPDAATRVTREVATTGDSNDPTVLAAIGLANLNVRLIASDAIGFRIATGDDDATGRYLPGPAGTDNGDFWLGDVVTLHTGSGDQDFDEADERVYAITISEDDGGNLEVTPEVGSVLGAAERALYGGSTVVQASFVTRSEFTDTAVAERAAPDFATPAIVLGAAAAAGSAATTIRSDATIVAFDATAPSTQAIGDAAAAGSAAIAAKRDHKHAITNPLTTAADLWVGGTSGAPSRLAKGSDSQVLTVDPTTHLLVWATPSSGFSDPMTNRGDIIVRNASNTTARLGIGSSGKVLSSDGTDISWQTPSAGGAAVGVSVYATVTQSIPNATGPVLTFDAEFFDTDGFHSTVTNTSRLTVPSGKDGKYIIGGGTYFASSGAGTYRIIAITKNGVAVPPHMRRGVAPTDPALALSGVVLDLVATDYIEIIAYQDSGGALNVGHASQAEFRSTLNMMRLGS